MTSPAPRLLVTAASGQLGRLVVARLLKNVPASQIAVAVRSEKAAAEFSALGVTAHIADYTQPASLEAAFAGVDRLLLISSSEIGQRFAQHKNAIDAAKKAGVKLIAYTSVLHADRSPLGLADEHRQTEAALAASGVPFALLRNGWYTENYLASLPSILAHGAHFGCAGDGKISSAPRADYADAAAAVLASTESHAGKVYELAGDSAYTLADFAAEVARLTGKPIAYQNLPEADFKGALLGAGLPEPIAELLANSDTGASNGALFDDSHTLSHLIGRPTEPLAVTLAAALNG